MHAPSLTSRRRHRRSSSIDLERGSAPTMDSSSTADNTTTNDPSTEAQRLQQQQQRDADADGIDRVLVPFAGCVFLLIVAYQLLGLPGLAGALGGIVGIIIARQIALTFFVLLLRPAGAGAAAAAAAAASSSGRTGAARTGVTVSVAWPPGMDTVAISVLPAAFRFKREDSTALGGWAQCAVCLGLIRVGESVRRLPACGHLFHACCVDRWFRNHPTCPLCRAAVGQEPELPPV